MDNRWPGDGHVDRRNDDRLAGNRNQPAAVPHVGELDVIQEYPFEFPVAALLVREIKITSEIDPAPIPRSGLRRERGRVT